ncbi:MAG TPA: ACP S-malonyltransferase [candidate division Zixibacteria bacterium]|nr:ACP S-malonyltransferase [candidate division Zixibacteria bacterium]
MSLALLFSPQGSQAVGMGRDLADAWPQAAEVYRQADAALGWSVSATCWTGPEERLNDTRQTQPCLVATSVACLRALEAAVAGVGGRLEPAFVAGHSVGEYAALVAAGVLSLSDAVRLVALRGSLMAETDVEGGMAAVLGLDREAVAEAVRRAADERGTPHDPVVANDNAPGQVVISGSRAALAAATARLTAAGAKRVLPLKVSGPFHSPFMAEAGRRLSEAFEHVAWRDPQPPLIANVTAEPVRDAGQVRELLARQVAAPVEWVRGVRRMVAEGVDTFVECGPGQALSGMVKRIAPEARTLNVADVASLEAAVRELTGVAAEASV